MRPARTIWGRRRLLGACGATTAFALVGPPPPQSGAKPPCDGIATGRACFSADIHLSGLRYAVIARPPTGSCELVAFDVAGTLAVPGVVAIAWVASPGGIPLRFPLLGGVAVVATNTWAALKGRDALKVTWKRGEASPGLDDASAERAALAESQPEADHYIPDLSTAPMETPSATVRIVGGACEVWVGARFPKLVRAEVAALLGLPLQAVTVTATVLGGGSGRTARPTYATEAAVISARLGGAPVKLLWTREDDVPFRRHVKPPWTVADATRGADGQHVSWLKPRALAVADPPVAGITRILRPVDML